MCLSNSTEEVMVDYFDVVCMDSGDSNVVLYIRFRVGSLENWLCIWSQVSNFTSITYFESFNTKASRNIQKHKNLYIYFHSQVALK